MGVLSAFLFCHIKYGQQNENLKVPPKSQNPTVCSCMNSKLSAWIRSMYRVWVICTMLQNDKVVYQN